MTEVNANSELQALIFGQFRIPRGHLALELEVTASVDACKLCQNGIPCFVNFATNTMR